MEIRISFDYREVTPASNGKRHSVTTYTDGLLISSIPEVSSQEAPVALIKTVHGERIEYRHFGGRLWTPDDSITAQAEISTSAPKSSLEILFSRQLRSGGRNECISQLNELISNLIAIDGRMHIKADEPFYHVMTFGLGGNHGSTALVVGSTPHDGQKPTSRRARRRRPLAFKRTKHGPASIVTGSAVLAGWRRLKIEQRHSATSMKAMPPSSRYGAPCICAIEQRSRRCLTQD
jgi:hypothetical protein